MLTTHNSREISFSDACILENTKIDNRRLHSHGLYVYRGYIFQWTVTAPVSDRTGMGTFFAEVEIFEASTGLPKAMLFGSASGCGYNKVLASLGFALDPVLANVRRGHESLVSCLNNYGVNESALSD